jgi:diacylglycerol kinase family enzyme
MNVLVVTNPFGGRETGERITDPAEIAAIKYGEHAHHVVTSDHADAPADSPIAPAAKATTKKKD